MKRATRGRRTAAGETWRLMSEFTMAQFSSRFDVLQELGLTPGHWKALRAIGHEAVSMSACAHSVGCDASTATWLIDRLEERGLVERRPSQTDRRVKGVVLTPAGVETRARLEAHFGEPPAALLALEPEELEALHGLLERLARPAPER